MWQAQTALHAEVCCREIVHAHRITGSGDRLQAPLHFFYRIGYGACMSVYQYHVFFCTNLRKNGAACCQRFNAQAMRDYAKKRSKELDIAGAGRVRINSAGCLDRCNEGPVLVVYPEGTWYRYVDQSDIDEIIDEHLVHGRVVDRLKI